MVARSKLKGIDGRAPPGSIVIIALQRGIPSKRNQTRSGGKFHLKLNIGERPIANKYCEGKMKRTLKRE
ncbi:hypothetical protein PSN45_002646 [Yamadazyma tenuis]|nr:hypothetical protein PSN45_002646 [Yamadazyma tenuis]